jgi:arylsulfatase
VRLGDWKLVAEHAKPWELYNIAQDRSEKRDLSQQEPERVKQMTVMYDTYAARANVEPWEKVTPKPKPKAEKKGKKKKEP